MASSEITAALVSSPVQLNARALDPAWEKAEPIRFSDDWQGRNADPELETEVRVLWSPEMLYLRFVCPYRELFVFEDSEPSGRRDHLWDRDVAEAFLRPPEAVGMDNGHVGTGALARAGEQSSPKSPSSAGVDARRYTYKELEVAPNGMWIDLDISPGGLADLKSGLARSVHVDEGRRIWTAELAIPMRVLTTQFDPALPWRANFYRVEGKVEPRRYMAWQPTHTPQPNFHVPEFFGTLSFGA